MYLFVHLLGYSLLAILEFSAKYTNFKLLEIDIVRRWILWPTTLVFINPKLQKWPNGATVGEGGYWISWMFLFVCGGGGGRHDNLAIFRGAPSSHLHFKGGVLNNIFFFFGGGGSMMNLSQLKGGLVSSRIFLMIF